jgi:hypothetical protein
MAKQPTPLEPIPFFEPANFVFAFLGAVSALIVGLMMFGNANDLHFEKSTKRNPASVVMPIDFEPLVYWADLSSPK